MKRFGIKSKLVAGAAVIALGVGATAAFAFWTQGGSGTGSASTGTTTDITVVQDSISAGTLYPGGPSEALSGHFANPNSGSVNITSVTAAVTGVTPLAGNTFASNGKPDCTTGDYGIGGTSGPYTVVSGNTTTWSGLNVSLSNTAANQDNCKGASIAITYTANA